MPGSFKRLVMNVICVTACFLICFSATVASAQIQVPSDSRLKFVTSTKTIRIAYRADARPFSFLNERNEIAGFTIDICKLVVKSMERQFGIDNLKIEWVPVTVETRFSVIANNKADMECGSSTVTLGRMKEVDFSNIIFVESTGLMVKREANSRTIADLAGKKIAVVAGTTNQRAINEQLKSRNIDATVVSVKGRDEGVAMLEAGSVDAYASDKLLLLGAHLNHPEALIMLPDDLSVEPYAITLPRGDWAFRLAVNTGLAQIYRTGQIAGLFNAWFDRVGLHSGPVMQITYGLGALSD